MTSHDEAFASTHTPRGGGWRRLSRPVTVRAFIGDLWMDAEAIDVNDETHEVRVRRPGGDVPHQEWHAILDASLYEAPPGGF
jgi:hypothetical protein